MLLPATPEEEEDDESNENEDVEIPLEVRPGEGAVAPGERADGAVEEGVSRPEVPRGRRTVSRADVQSEARVRRCATVQRGRAGLAGALTGGAQALLLRRRDCVSGAGVAVSRRTGAMGGGGWSVSVRDGASGAGAGVSPGQRTMPLAVRLGLRDSRSPSESVGRRVLARDSADVCGSSCCCRCWGGFVVTTRPMSSGDAVLCLLGERKKKVK